MDPIFYTGKGDRGDTGRLGPGRLPKDALLIETLGTFDEATSALGMGRAWAQDSEVRRVIPEVQRHLYRLMSHLSATAEARLQFSGLTQTELHWLEEELAGLEKNVPALQGFVLPGDSSAGAALHLARTVVRRAERRLVALMAQEDEAGIGEENLAYVNRLSSWCFVAALCEDQRAGQLSTPARTV